jgi:hypothetical protein
MLIVLAVTGYLLYYLGDETLRSAASVLHWSVGLGAPILYGAHRLKIKRERATTRAAQRPVHPSLTQIPSSSVVP